ncbi:MAG: Rpn family recombination-promoting nuclease/putative transposase [Lachnospiraceae bacterium]|nr:Rpn family recombination-promoting nuclease/putative transposase [Lachnospiraceae bacterium]
MQADLKNTLIAADNMTQYDIYARDLLARKGILAHILTATVDEFKSIPPKEVEGYIEGDIYVGLVPAEPGLTNTEFVNANGDRVKGFNTVQSEKQEGLVIFDIVFYVRMRDGLSQIIINVEAQKDDPSEYDILNRAIFYVSRLVSSQKERDFTRKNFNDLKRVYSIWVCMNMDECIWNYIRLANYPILGNHEWKGKLDLLNIVLLGIPNELPECGEKYELHRLLSVLFSNQLTPNERIDILENEYYIAAGTFEEEMKIMCNLSEGIYERGVAEGEARGKAEGKAEEKERLIISMDKEGLPSEIISKVTGETIEKIRSILENHKVIAVGS